jgi:hypothetical protein
MSIAKQNQKLALFCKLLSVLIPQVIGNTLEKDLSKDGICSQGITIPEKNRIRYSKMELKAPTRLKINPKDAMKSPNP